MTLQGVRCRRVSHTNIVIENFDESIRFLEDVYGAWFMSDMPKELWHACLIEVGGLVIELFEPKNFLLHGRVGAHYLGIEYEADVIEARAAAADHGVGILRDVEVAFHSDPRTSLGVDYEFYGHTFYGPTATHITNHTKPPEYWRDHPIGFRGLYGYTHLVADLEAASQFLQSFLHAKPAYEAAREALGARAIGLRIADDICELISPVGEGALLGNALTSSQGIRSTIYSVVDIDRTRKYLEGKGLRVIDGTCPGDIAVDPRDHLGIMFEFTGRNPPE